MRKFLTLIACGAAFVWLQGCGEPKAPLDSHNIESAKPHNGADSKDSQSTQGADSKALDSQTLQENKSGADDSTPCVNGAESKDTKTDSKPAQSLESEQSAESEEVYVDEGVFYELSEGDAEIALYGDSYALLPQSSALKAFLIKQSSPLKARTLRSQSGTTQIYNEGKDILFYHSSTGSNLYAKIAPKRYKLTLEEWLDESKDPQEIESIYRIKNFDKKILNAPCKIIQTRAFVRDRARSEMLINLDSKINPKIASEGEIELFLECRLPRENDSLRPLKRASALP